MIVFFDFETGGLKPESPNIQLAAIAVDDTLNHLDTFESKIAFDESAADPEALRLNHYEKSAWAEAPSEKEVASQFSLFLGKYKSINLVSKRTGNPYSVARLAGHNAATFDGPRLKSMFEAHGMFLPAHPLVLDTVQLAMWKYQRVGKSLESYRLSSLCEVLSVSAESNEFHDALADVWLTVKVAKKLLFGKGEINGNPDTASTTTTA